MDPRFHNRRTGLSLAMMALAMGEEQPEDVREPVIMIPPSIDYTLPSSMPMLLMSNTEAPVHLPLLAGMDIEGDSTDLRMPELPMHWQAPPQAHHHEVTGPAKTCATCHKRLTGQELREARLRRAVAEGKEAPRLWTTPWRQAVPPIMIAPWPTPLHRWEDDPIAVDHESSKA